MKLALAASRPPLDLRAWKGGQVGAQGGQFAGSLNVLLGSIYRNNQSDQKNHFHQIRIFSISISIFIMIFRKIAKIQFPL